MSSSTCSHGKLLEATLEKLPRSHFYVILIVVLNGGSTLSPSITDSVDDIITLNSGFLINRKVIGNLELDFLIYADIMSEPMSYFMSFARLAEIQMVFWGNPVTSGIDTIDYFITADILEGAAVLDRYSEQPLLLDGQGIYYKQYNMQRATGQQKLSRMSLGFSKDWVIYICPQSIFKLHPSFDVLVGRILKNNVNFHLLLLEGRHKAWTAAIKKRMSTALGDEMFHRIHFVGRVNGKMIIVFVFIIDIH